MSWSVTLKGYRNGSFCTMTALYVNAPTAKEAKAKALEEVNNSAYWKSFGLTFKVSMIELMFYLP